MALTVLDHSLARHFLCRLRQAETGPEEFRSVTRALTYVLVSEAARRLPTRPVRVRTPLEEADGQELERVLALVPVLRAGLGMLDAALELLTYAAVGYVGLERDETTAVARSYYCKLPPIVDATVLLLDPMLATGGSACWAANRIFEAGARNATLVCVVAAPEGVARLSIEAPRLDIVAAALDRELNARSYILPGLGDFGDRLYGTG